MMGEMEGGITTAATKGRIRDIILGMDRHYKMQKETNKKSQREMEGNEILNHLICIFNY